MDLRNMLNDGSGPAAQTHAAAPGPAPAPASASSPPKPPPQPRPTSQHRPQQSQQLPPQQHPLPSTPIQNGPHPTFDYPHSVQPSPARSVSRDYHSAHQTPFTSPPPHGGAAPYAAPGRPQPPPLQQLSSSHDMRSPNSSSIPLQSPYARTPVTSMRTENTAYPFPPSHAQPDLASPVQSNRYPPSASYPSRDPRDSYSQSSGPMASPSATGHPSSGYYPGPPTMPQTPPVGTPGGAHSHLLTQQHGRSGSAHAYHAYAPSQPFASPVTTNHPLPPSDHMRPPSQPPTPHGPPLSAGSRQSVGAGVFAQPSSPYQQRVSSSGVPYSPFPQQQQHPQPPQQPSPHVAPHPQPSPKGAIQRAQSVYDQSPAQHHHPHAVDPHRASLSQSDRERSVSVSPKTRVPSLPSSAGHHSQASLSGPSGPPPDFALRSASSNPNQNRDAQVKLDHEDPPLTAARPEHASTPAKRKMDDRDVKQEDLEQQEPRPPPFANGSHRPQSSSRPIAAHHADATMSARRRPRHARAPVWALLYDRQQLKNGNHYLRKPTINHPHVNGSAQSSNAIARPERAGSRHVSPEASRASVQGLVATQPAPAPAQPPKPQMLGPWEPTIANVTPFNDVVQSVADFLFLNVVHPSELTNLHGTPGVHFEIEAKLGYLATGHGGERFRFQPPLLAESVLDPHANYTPNFVSDMDESKHKFFNEHLNALVKLSSPQNPNNKNAAEPRVPINYVHTKEIDRFLDLKDPRQALPPVLLRLIEEKRARMPSIRVTRDKNNRVIAKIIKVKVEDLHIHMPKALLDCRITVNVEVDYHGPLDGLDGGVGQPDRTDRHKDRLSYRQGLYQVDLTQVSQPEAGSGPQHKKHELEIELNTEALFDQGKRAAQDAPNNYDFLVEGFVNNIRYLARKITTMGPLR